MISASASEEVQLDASLFLAKIAQAFGPTSTSYLFKLFGTYQGVSDLIFMDRTVNLRVLAMNETYDSILGDEFESSMRVIDPEECRDISAAYQTKMPFFLIVSILIILFN